MIAAAAINRRMPGPRPLLLPLVPFESPSARAIARGVSSLGWNFPRRRLPVGSASLAAASPLARSSSVLRVDIEHVFGIIPAVPPPIGVASDETRRRPEAEDPALHR